MKWLCLLLLLLGLPFVAQAQEAKVQARLVAEGGAVPGGTVTVALEEKIAPGWHTYWQNPGDAGAPSRIAWTLPPGWKAGPIQWPLPKRLPVGPLTDYGYEGKVWLLTRIAIPAGAAKQGVIQAHASWLVCKNICVPEEQSLSVTVRPGPTPDPAVAKAFEDARARLPVASPWKLTYALGDALDLYVAAPSLAASHPVAVDFFPARAGLIRNAVPPQVGYTQDGLVLRLAPGNAVRGTLQGVLVLTSHDGSVQALDVTATPGAVPPAQFAVGENDGMALGLAVLFAFLGGLILNVMPCVLPILAMKALALARHGNEGRGESFAYATGAVSSFAALGLAIVALRAAGHSVGWGFQLQSPVTVAAFALLVFTVGLNLSGIFEIGSVTAGEGLTRKSGYAGAFFTGVLAVGVAAPCTAPFMAAALGFALSQTALRALAIFVALGVGFALPFILLGIWPRALSFLPRPGPWMLILKQFLSFPMYAATAWLVWVLAQEAGPRGTVTVLAIMIAIAFAAWLWRTTRDLGTRGRGAGVAAALVVLVTALSALTFLIGTAAPIQTAQGARKGEPYSAAGLAAYRAKGVPVFVDATAAWCITCLVNEDAVLSKGGVGQAFADRHVVYMVADWTSQNPDITALLKSNGRSGVPMYAYYAPRAEKPVLLPQILTEEQVLKAIEESASRG